jgi:hypothetical protein
MSNLSSKQITFAANAAKLIDHIFASGYACTIGEAWRSPEQAAIYAHEGKGIIDSLHCQRLAIDLNLFKDGVYLDQTKDYAWLEPFWKSLHPNNRWGGIFTRADGNHFEMQNL